VVCFIPENLRNNLIKKALETEFCKPQNLEELFTDSLQLPSSLYAKFKGVLAGATTAVSESVAHYTPIIVKNTATTAATVMSNIRELVSPVNTPTTKINNLVKHLITYKTNWNSPEHPLPDELRHAAIDIQLDYIRVLLNDIIVGFDQNSNVKLTDTDDFKKTGLIIGQQICGLGAFKNPLETIAGEVGGKFSEENLSHCGIYVGNGLVWEVGGGEYTQFENVRDNQETTAGLSSLADWSYNKVYVITTPDDANPIIVAERLARLISVTGTLSYNIIWRNCQTLANFITFGTKFSQPEGGIYLAVTAVTVLVLNVKKLGNWALQRFRR
jgi:hypothetical protein